MTTKTIESTTYTVILKEKARGRASLTVAVTLKNKLDWGTERNFSLFLPDDGKVLRDLIRAARQGTVQAFLGRHGYDAFGNQFGGRGGTWGPL